MDSSADYKTKTQFILPFNEVLMVSNGGRSVETNNHMKFALGDGPKNQLFAYDFRTKDHKGEGKLLEDYPVYGIEIIAPADGEVVQVINGAIDVLPGERDRGVGVGNMIILDHGNEEFSLICHFQYNSIKVHVGQQVKQRDVLGKCGNTGNTSEPHIHINLQDSPRMHRAQALPMQFQALYVNGQIKKQYEPVRFDIVSNLE